VSPTVGEENETARRIDRLLQSILSLHRQPSNRSRSYLILSQFRSAGEGEHRMTDNPQSVPALSGISPTSIADAIAHAVAPAATPIRNLDWFETREIRGHIKDGKIVHYQVVLKIGFRYDDAEASSRQ